MSNKPTHVEEKTPDHIHVGKNKFEKRAEKIRGLSNRAESKAEKAEQKLEQGKGNPVDVALFERQKAIDAKLDAIMDELGISE